MFDPCVVVFNTGAVPLRHIISLQSSYDAEEFRSWYYTQYNQLENDQFVYCETKKERDELLSRLKDTHAYRLTTPVWCEVEDPDGDIEDMSSIRLRKVTDKLAGAFAMYVAKTPLGLEEIEQDAASRHLVHLSPAIVTGPTGEPQLEIVIWLDQENISERQWNLLLDDMSRCLLDGWGQKVAEETLAICDDNALWLHFGELGEEIVRFTVDE